MDRFWATMEPCDADKYPLSGFVSAGAGLVCRTPTENEPQTTVRLEFHSAVRIEPWAVICVQLWSS